MKTDIEISNEVNKQDIIDIAKKIGLSSTQIDCYGHYKAKINVNSINTNKDGNIVLVTAITPTKFGEGKTTVSIGLADALNKLHYNSILALREPSLGPVFGMKGGATGGGYSQVVPMEDINLHFTGDIHAITSANNLLAAAIDNHIFQGNELNIDPRTIRIKRCVDLNDRELRNVVVGLNGKSNGVPREDSFCITVATEIMAIFCLSKDIDELKSNLDNMIIGNDYEKNYVYVKQLDISGSLIVLLKEAFKPNIVQTLEGTPAIIHGGPFANIAHGCNSIIATNVATKLADYVITEAGFGSDLGAEKFLNIKCRRLNKFPKCVVLVATIRALKAHGNSIDPNKEDINAMTIGFNNLKKHYFNLTNIFNLNVIVALNKFAFDSDNELNEFDKLCKENNIEYSISSGFTNGGDGCIDLAKKVIEKIKYNKKLFKYAYDLSDDIITKINKICKNIYNSSNVVFSVKALQKIKEILKNPIFNNYPICIAKTQYSFSGDKNLLNVPANFQINVTNIEIKNGAKFIVVYVGDILTMPGLPKNPNYKNIDFKDNKIIGIF